VAPIAANAGHTARETYPEWPSPRSENRCSASKLVRLDTGRSREAVLASQTVVMAKGNGFNLS
jgi:hypothetical protein